jgi:hypothetical protein
MPTHEKRSLIDIYVLVQIKKERKHKWIASLLRETCWYKNSHQSQPIIRWPIGGAIISCCWPIRCFCTFPIHPMEGSRPRFLSSRYSWQRAQYSQKQWVIQSGAGASGNPYLLRSLVRNVHVYTHGIANKQHINPYNIPAVPQLVAPSSITSAICPNVTNGKQHVMRANTKTQRIQKNHFAM